ncbi:MAG: hypothetical protein LBK95_07105, partial [Bifidobacteriaceae bacterium]|nr:hypothetical protein [Bifidobacteriaceae bacterium]
MFAQPQSHGLRWRWALSTLTAAGLAATLTVTAPTAAFADPDPADLGPLVTHTGTAPTGYEVTFRYYDATATRMQISGEWFFSDAEHSSYSSSEGRTPDQWKPGDFPLAYPSMVGANGPVTDMVKGSDDIWTYTVPLPSGTFNYYFFKDCLSNTGSGCTRLSDPANPHWNDGPGGGTQQVTSQVYVPSDPSFGTQDLSWQAPATNQGTLQSITYPSPGAVQCGQWCVTGPEEHNATVYLPPGYDPTRATAYPTLYLLHGANGHENNWWTESPGGNILDNAIERGLMQPVVAVSVNWYSIDSSTGTPQPASFYREIHDFVIPYIESHYNVSTKASDRALAGLSAGGQRTNYVLYNDPELFGYYGIFSHSGSYTVTDQNRAAIQSRLGIFIGVGYQDPLYPRSQTQMASFDTEGIAYVDGNTNGGHDTPVWRALLWDFVQRVAFRTTKTVASTDVTGATLTANAVVAAATKNAAAPTG